MPCDCSHMQREGDVRKNQMWHFPCWGKQIFCGLHTVQLMAILECRTMIVNNTGKVSWWLSVVFLKACLSNLFLCTCCQLSFYHCIWLLPLIFLPSHYHYHYGGHERRKAKEAYNIRYWSTPITTQREKTRVQGLHNSDWTVRSIGCSISHCHGN